MPLQATSGAASYDAFGGGVPVVPKYIEDYFSTFLFPATGSDQTITNNIDLSTKGGLVWLKKRTYPSGSVISHYLMDTNRGTSAGYLSSNSTDGENAFDIVSSFNTNGFGFNTPVNDSGDTYTSWSWAKAPKFFDVVTYTGTGSVQNISHNLGSVPGCIIVKSTTATEWWAVQHRSLGATKSLYLNSTNAEETNATNWNNTSPTSTRFTVGTNTPTNLNGATYVAYLFAHNAGGFGLTGTDNVISCGSYTGNGSTNGPTVTLGYEPQWLMIKNASNSGSWQIIDNMRGMCVGTSDQRLIANLATAEFTNDYLSPTATGFNLVSDSGEVNGNGNTMIYIAIRRGPMKVPTSGASVFSPVAYTGNGSTRTYSVGFPTDLSINMNRNGAGDSPTWNDRLRGSGFDLYSNSTGSEQNNGSAGVQFDNQTNIVVPSYRITNGTPYIDWCMRRAPGFFDEVCYTGVSNGSTPPLTLNHNLGVKPELMIVKARTDVGPLPSTVWLVYSGNKDYYMALNTTAANAFGYPSPWVNEPTATQFTVGVYGDVNYLNNKYVAYLFASCPGVSKVGSYTGTGTTQTINCGFTAGSRFVMIKRTDSTGDWVLWDSSRGMVAGTDPRLALNSTAAEVNQNWVYTTTGGFQIVTSDATVNASGGSYIYLSIA